MTGFFVRLFNRLRRVIRDIERAALQRELLAACGRTFAFMREDHSLDAAEGLFLASLLSTVLWSLILFTVSHLR